MSTTQQRHGLTEDEQKVADLLDATWAAFMALEESIPADQWQRMERAIIDAKLVLMERIARRVYPNWNMP